MAVPRMSFRTLQQRLGLLPVAVVLCVSLVANFFVHRRARDELYQSRTQLAHGLALSLGKRLSDELSDIRHELSAWARFFTPAMAPTGPGSNDRQAGFQEWLRGLGERTTSRYDMITLVGADERIVAINGTALSDTPTRRIESRRLLGQSLRSLTGESDTAWLNATLREGRMSGLSWRSMRVVNDLYRRRKPETADDLVRWHQIVVAVPVLSPGQGAVVQGALVAVSSWAPFQQIVDEAELYFSNIGLRTGYGFLFDSGADRIVAHKFRDPSNSNDLGNLLGRSVSKDFTLPQVMAAAAAARREPTEYDFPLGNKKFAVFAAIDPSSTSPAFAFDWRLGIGVDYSDIFAPLARLRATTIWATIALAGAVAFVNLWLARRLSLSVREFTRLVTEATEGRFRLLEPSTSHDEISDLGSAWNRLLVSMREDAGVQPIPNPYVVGTPVRSAQMFFGREEDLRWIGDRLNQPGNELIVLYGQRRIGKTSLVHQVRHGRAASDVLCFFIDTHSLLPSVESDDDFYAGVGRIIVDQASPGLESHPPVRTAADLCALIKSLNAASPHAIVVLLFDELEALEARVRDGVVSTAISSFLVSLLESELRVSMVVTGSSDGTRLAHPFWATLAPKSIARHVRLLSRAEGLRLITEPVGGQIEFEDMLPERILRLTGSHPYYTQTVCQRLVDLLNERHSRRASTAVLERVVERLLTEPPLPLDDMWCNLSSIQRWILAELGRLLQSAEGTVTADSLWVNADAGVLGSPASIGSELRRLTTADILEETEGGYRFAVDFVRLWIRKEQRWWEVARERMGHARQRQSVS